MHSVCSMQLIYIYMSYVYTPYIRSKNICIHTYIYVNKWVHWMGWAKQDLPTREEIAVDCSSRREGSTLERVEKEAPGRGIRRNYTYFRRERPTSYYPSDPMPCMLSETRRVAPGRAGCVFLRIGWVCVGSHRQQQTRLLFLSQRTWKMRDWLKQCSIRARDRGPSWGPVWPPSFMTTLNDKDTTHAGQAKHFGSTTPLGSLLSHHQEAVGITSEQKSKNFKRSPIELTHIFAETSMGLQMTTEPSLKEVPALGNQSQRGGSWITASGTFFHSVFPFHCPGERSIRKGQERRDGADYVSLSHCRTLSWEWGGALQWR